MKIRIDHNTNSVFFDGEYPAVPDDSVLMVYSYGSSDVLTAIKRNLKKEYKDFCMHMNSLGFRNDGEGCFFCDSDELFRAKVKEIHIGLLMKMHAALFDKPDRWHGQIIQDRRRELGISTDKGAEMLGIHKSSLSLIENGKMFNPELIKKACIVFGCSFSFPDEVRLFERKR